MTYKEKLRDPRWQKKRLLVLERDEWRCVICGEADRNIQVHHCTYRKIDPWDYPDHLLQTLCDACHETRQELTDIAVDALRIAVKDYKTERLHSACNRLIASAMDELP